MAEDMLGRAARALMERKIPAYKDDAIWAEDRASILMRLARDQDGFAEARTALLAALDPEDEALQQLWGDVIDRFSDPASHHCMATFFAELKAMAPGRDKVTEDIRRQSKRDTITRSEFYQLAGLLALAERHEKALKELEAAALAITQEVDHKGEPIETWGGGHTGDAIYGGTHTAEGLLKLLCIKIQEEPDGTQAA